MLGPYREILAAPGALRFTAAGALARLPMSMIGIGIVLLVAQSYGSYGLAGRVAAANAIAWSACAPHIARLVDRLGQARVMRPLTAAFGLALAALIVAGSLRAPTWVLYVTSALAGACGGSVGAMVRARWTLLLTDPRLVHTAFSLESALDEMVFVLGPPTATVLATQVAPGAGLAVALGGAVVGGFWFLSQRATEPPPHPRPPAGRARRSVLRTPGLAVLIPLFLAQGVMFGAIDVATIAFAEQQGRPALAGAVLACFATGSLIAGLLYGARHWSGPLWRRFVVGQVALAAGTATLPLADTLGRLAAVAFLVGFTIAPTMIAANGLIQEIVPAGRLTEGLTWGGTALGAGVALGAPAAGGIVDAAGAGAGFLVVVAAAAAALVGALLAVPLLRAQHPPGEGLPADARPEGEAQEVGRG